MVTHYSLQFTGRSLAFTATAGSFELTDNDSNPQACISIGPLGARSWRDRTPLSLIGERRHIAGMAARVTLALHDGGHMFYTHNASRFALHDEARTLERAR